MSNVLSLELALKYLAFLLKYALLFRVLKYALQRHHLEDVLKYHFPALLSPESWRNKTSSPGAGTQSGLSGGYLTSGMNSHRPQRRPPVLGYLTGTDPGPRNEHQGGLVLLSVLTALRGVVAGPAFLPRACRTSRSGTKLDRADWHGRRRRLRAGTSLC